MPGLAERKGLEFAAVTNGFDQALQLLVESRFRTVPEARVYGAYVAVRIRTEPCLLHCPAQTRDTDLGGGEPVSDLRFDTTLCFPLAVCQAIERQRRFIPATGLHVVHVVTKNP